MKTLTKLFYILCVAICGVGCAAVDFEISYESSPSTGGDWEYFTTFGMAGRDSDDYVVVADNGEVLIVGEIDNMLTWNDVARMGKNTDGRVLINYNILYSLKPNTYSVRLNRIYDLSIAQIESVDGNTIEGGSKALLQDPARPYVFALGAGYINLGIEYASTDELAEAPSDIKLYFDTSASTDDTTLFSLVYDAPVSVLAGATTTRMKWISFVCPDGRYGGAYERCVNAQFVAFQYCWWENSYSSAYDMGKIGVFSSDSSASGGRWMMW